MKTPHTKKTTPKKKEEIQSKVSVFASGNGFFIEVSDQYTVERLAVTHEELEQIVLYGGILTRSLPKKQK